MPVQSCRAIQLQVSRSSCRMVVLRWFAFHYFFSQFTEWMFFFCEHLIAFKSDLFDPIPSSIIQGWGCNFSTSFIKIYCYSVMLFCRFYSVLCVLRETGLFFFFFVFFFSFFFFDYGFFIFLLRKRNLIQDTGNKKVGEEMRNGQGNQQKSSGKVFKSIPLLHVYLQESGPSTFLYQRKVYFINDLTPKLVTDIKGKQTSKQTKVNP